VPEAGSQKPEGCATEIIGWLQFSGFRLPAFGHCATFGQ
jgi:hypothetical protein